MGKTEKKTGPSSGEGLTGNHCKVRLRFGRWNKLAAGGILALAAAFFGWEVYLFAAAEEQELTAAAFAGYGVGFWLLSLAAAAACFLEVKLPPRAGRLISWAVLLLLPLGSFIAVDFINSTRILNFSFQTGLANYLCYLMVFAVIYALSRRVWVTALAGGLIFLVFGIANYFVVQFRGQPILP